MTIRAAQPEHSWTMSHQRLDPCTSSSSSVLHRHVSLVLHAMNPQEERALLEQGGLM